MRQGELAFELPIVVVDGVEMPLAQMLVDRVVLVANFSITHPALVQDAIAEEVHAFLETVLETRSLGLAMQVQGQPIFELCPTAFAEVGVLIGPLSNGRIQTWFDHRRMELNRGGELEIILDLEIMLSLYVSSEMIMLPLQLPETDVAMQFDLRPR